MTPQHPSPPIRHPIIWRRSPTAFLLLFALFVPLASLAQEAAPAEKKEQKDKKEKKARRPDFLIFGTVFNEQGFSLPGAEVKVRKAGEKKVLGEAISDRRGEFGVRVLRGSEYEVSVKRKGYLAQTQKVNAAAGTIREDITFRMAPEAGGKKK